MVRVVKIVKTLEASPAQWDGMTDDNRQIYVRYRWGCLTIELGVAGDMSEYAAVNGEKILSMKHGGKYQGVMEYSELKELSASVVEFPDYEDENLDWQINSL